MTMIESVDRRAGEDRPRGESEAAAFDESWQAKAALCELLALSLRYPERRLVEAVASGEWADAACELSEMLGMDPPNVLAESGLHPVGPVGKKEEGPWPFDGDGELSSQAPASRGGDASPQRMDQGALLHALRAEATRLFVVAPNPAVSPYEGIWRAKDDGVQGLLFVNPHSMDVERFCASCGLGRPEGVNEPLDHIATELELLQYLASLAAGIAAPAEGGPSPSELPGGSPEAAYAQFLEEHLLVWAPRFAEVVEARARHPFYKAVAELLKAFLQAAQRS